MAEKHLIDVRADYGGTWKLQKIERIGNQKISTPINYFEDYFYCTESKLDELYSNDVTSKVITRVEECSIPALFTEEPIMKVFVKTLWSKFKIKKEFEGRMKGLYELDVPANMRYMIDHVPSFPKTKYKILYFDIETTTNEGFPDWGNAVEQVTVINMYDSFSEQYYCFVLNPDDTIKNDKHEGNKNVLYFDEEKEMIQTFINKIKEEQYDIITAWNISFDFSYLFGRCDKLGLDKKKFSPYNNVGIRMAMNKQGREDMFISIEGIFVMDLLLRYKGVTFKEIPSYSLGYVAHLELGTELEKKQVLDFTKEWKENLDDLINYSFRDVEILVELDKKLNLLHYLEELRQISGAPNIEIASISKNLTDLAILRMYKDKIIMPSGEGKARKKFGGGYLKVPTPGVYDYVTVYDFSGMYPSLIRTFNLSKECIVNEEEADFVTHEDDIDEAKMGRKGFVTGWSLKTKGIIPNILEMFLNTRYAIKRKMKETDKDSIEYRDMNLRQYALKAPINANYGVNAYPNFRLYEPRVAATITYLGRQLSQYCSSRVEEDYGKPNLYSDTDSFFIHIGENNKELEMQIEKDINEKYVPEFVEKIGNGKIKDNYIKIENEKTFEKLLLIKKRRYLGKMTSGKWMYKGVDLKRSNTPDIIREILQFYIDELFAGKDEKITLKECFKKLDREKDLDKFKIPLKISKSIDLKEMDTKIEKVETSKLSRLDKDEKIALIKDKYYVTNLPQKRAAEWSNKNIKTSFKQGSKFYGIHVERADTDIIGFTQVDELKGYDIKPNMKKYIEMLADKIENLKEDSYKVDNSSKDIYQQTLF